MKNILLVITLAFISLVTKAGGKDSTINYDLPDSVKAVTFMAEIKVTDLNVHRSMNVGIEASYVRFYLGDWKGKHGIYFQSHEFSRLLSLGQGVKLLSHGGASFEYNWQTNKAYKLLLTTAFDSASKLTVYSAYIFLPDENKWKFIVSVKHPFYDSYLKMPKAFIRSDKKTTGNVVIRDVWAQRNTGSWKNLKNETLPSPIINWFGHVDSVQQRQIDIKIIEDAIASGKTDVKENVQSIYYKMMKEGTGRQVTVDDTVTVYYKGYLFVNDSVFDQTKEKPATFPLKRLIRGWQIGVPLCKVGGKIKLVIPSDLAYTIRTRSAKIPPNSILVFEIEVLEAKSPH